MKIQLDYDSKTVTIDKSVDLGEFFDIIEKILPKWKEWKLNTTSSITSKEIHYIDRPYYHRPWYECQPIYAGDVAPTFTAGGSIVSNTLDAINSSGQSPNEGSYCLSIGK